MIEGVKDPDNQHYSEKLVNSIMRNVWSGERTIDELNKCGCESCKEAVRRLTKEGLA